MKRLAMVALIALLGTGALAGEGAVTRVKAAGDVDVTMDALEAAVTEAGATVFARVDHAAGAQDVDMELSPAQLLIFGNPALGTPAMQDDALAGLYLPLRVLVYQGGDGQVWLAYEDPADMMADLGGVAPDADYISKMQGALKALTGKASGM
ncbi:DUF302 domain-containing protein [Roseovarius sp. D0-M9]|uniref:DUF302 domain-containing protein n=1 Tax=Roseovarius sp. D0-M9 TaxID=3127117 RepID=UPI003FA6EFDB